MSLAKADRALGADDRITALEELLEAWRATRAPAIADVIDVVSDDLTRALPPIENKSKSALQSTWLEVASHDDVADMGRLLRVLDAEPCTLMRDRVDRLAVRPHDPRVSRALMAFISRQPCACTSTPNGPMWTQIFKMVIAIGDVRARPALAARGGPSRRSAGTFNKMLQARATKALESLIDPPPLSSNDLALLAEIHTKASRLALGPPAKRIPKRVATAPSTETELLEHVYAAPEEDAPRLVYADWMTERGDPRGELIVLQSKKSALTKSESKREKALLREHARLWLGPLEPVIAKDNIVYERGFVSACELAFKNDTQRAQLRRHPAWATVRSLRLPEAALLVPADASSMRALREVVDLSVDRLREIETLDETKRGLPAIASVRFHVSARNPPVPFDVVQRTFPRLERVALRFREYITYDLATYAWMIEGAWPESVQHVEIVAFATHAQEPKLAAWLPRVPVRIKTFILDLGSWRFTATRAGTRWLIAAEPTNPYSLHEWRLKTRTAVLKGLNDALATVTNLPLPKRRS